MAHSAKRKAAVIADLLGGMSYDKAAKKHVVGKATVVSWAAELKPDQNRPKTDRSVLAQCKEDEFWREIEELAISQVRSLKAINNLIASESYASQQPPSALAELIQTAQECGARLLGGIASLRDQHREPAGPALPGVATNGAAKNVVRGS